MTKKPFATRLLLLMVLCLMFISVRLIALIPLLLPIECAQMNDKVLFLIKIACSLLLYFFVVCPQRIYQNMVLRFLYSGKHIHFFYLDAVKRSWFRIKRVLKYLVPFVCLVGLFMYLFWFGDITSLKLLKPIGTLFGATGKTPYDVGVIVITIPLFIVTFLLLFFYHRDYPYDYILSHRRAYNVKKSKDFYKVSIQNVLLSIVPAVFFLLVIFQNVIRNVKLKEGLFSFVTSFIKQIKTPLDNEQWATLTVIFLFIYLPIYFIRKVNAVKLCIKEGTKIYAP